MLLALGVFVFAGVTALKAPSVVNVPPSSGGNLGAVSGPDVTNRMFLSGGATVGSGCFATSSDGVIPVSKLENSCIYITATGAGQAVLSLTLPASSTMDRFIPKAGNCTSWFIDASDVAAATTTTIVAGAGWDLVGLDATGAGTGADVIDGAEFGKLTACRQNDGKSIVGYVEEWLAAD